VIFREDVGGIHVLRISVVDVTEKGYPDHVGMTSLTSHAGFSLSVVNNTEVSAIQQSPTPVIIAAADKMRT